MAKTTSQPARRTVHRSSVSGEFVTRDYAQRHPRTTETERVRVTNEQPKKGK